MSPSPSPADGVGELRLRLPARSIKSQRTKDLARTNVIDLTVESDGDEISEIPLNEFVEATVLVKKEPKEPVGILDKIPETDREAERDVFESTEMEGISTSAITRVTRRVNPEATLGEAAVVHNVASTDISAEAIALENNSTVFIPPRPAAIQLSREELIARDKELDLMLQNGIITLRASQDQKSLPITPQQSKNRNYPSPHPPTPTYINDQDADAADAAAAANFQQLKQWYEARERRAVTTFSEDIEYEKACQAEENRIRLQKKKRTYAEQEAQETANDERLFFSDIENAPTKGPSDFPAVSSGSDREAPTSKRAKINRPNKIPSFALEESMRIGFEAENSRSKGSAKKQRKRKDSAKKASTDTVKKLKGKKDVQKSRKKGRPRKGPEITNLASLLTHNLIADAQANQDRPGAPVFTSNRRKDALKELIASMPTDQQKLYTADRTALDKACRSFSGVQSIKAKGSSGWLLRGMRSALQNYQLLGTAFMRERENCGKRPFGGIQSDEMGLGKTVMMIANILDGKASDRSPNRTTLIVCPPALTTQWMNEIEKHTEPGALGEVIVYRSGTRIMSSDPVRTLSNMDVVITTYQEVLRSFPHCEAPLHLVSEADKQLWWANNYQAKRGPLHKIFFRRIVLDEGHLIKNHMSKTSVAVRALCGKYRWAITGTPIQNSLEEFFPYFAFLKVEHTGTFETFKRNFCKKGSALAMERLKVFLQKILVRRTHADEMFGRPILKLPKIHQETVEVEFNEVERAIYRIVKTRFINKIRAFAKADAIDKKFQQVFTLLLRLRQLAGHILLIAKTLKELMESEDIERLWRLTENEGKVFDENRDVLRMLQQGLESAENTEPTARPDLETGDQETNSPPEKIPLSTEAGDIDKNCVAGLSFRFRRYLKSLREDGRWEKIAQSSLCHCCNSIPKNPHITSCMHVYCLECLESIAYSAAQQENVKANCIECGTEYEKVEPCRGFEEAAREDGSTVSVRSAGKKRKKSEGDEEDADWFSVGGPVLRSAKTKAAEAQIEAWLADDPDAKIIVFTQFIGMLKVMSRICTEREWGHTLFHGGMSFDSRDIAIQGFSNDADTKVLCASLKAGGVGLNLTAASRVIIIDLWWNESVETQAFCRVFRIGQTRDVELRRFVVKDSVDTDILKMQERKNSEIGAVNERRRTKLTTQEMLRLFGPLTMGEEGEIVAEGEDEPFIFVQDPFEHHDSDSDGELPQTIPARPF